MKFQFSIEYHTQWGEDLRIHIENNDYKLFTNDGITWSCTLKLSPSKKDRLYYYYMLYRNDKLVWREWEVSPHTIYIKNLCKPDKPTFTERVFVIDDFWRPIPDNLPLFTSAFTEIGGSHPHTDFSELQQYPSTLQLRVVEPRLTKNQRLGIIGNIRQLGNWEKAVEMKLVGVQEWCVNLDTDSIFHPIEYKYVIIGNDNSIELWEEGSNRLIGNTPINGMEQTWVKTDSSPRFAVTNWKSAGVVIPVFSLRSEHSFGVGDFGDLKEAISWASEVGMHVVQILPINDTMMSGSWTDSYPYSSISIYAFHPLYADIRALPPLANKLDMEKFLIAQQELNRNPKMDYEASIKVKMDYFRKLFDQEWDNVSSSDEYKDFFASNRTWLIPYAAFSYLRDLHGTADFNNWPSHHIYNKSGINKLCSPKSSHYHQIALYYFIQFMLHKQLIGVHEHSKSCGVIIKGDIPIGINRCSVEAWSEPHLFNMDSQTGAPPDDFSENGQNWGFPTYNWRMMKEDDYSWWKDRFKKMSEYFDAYRIDHVLGFFRIWEIPLHSVHGLLGHFSPSLPYSQSEIENYGFHFNRSLMTRPYINDDIVYRIFGYRAEMVKMLYLDAVGNSTEGATYNAFGGLNGLYKLKSDYDTQRKVEHEFHGKDDEESLTIRDGLYRLISNVLFVVDPNNPHGYHPRINAQKDLAYEYLSDNEKHAFDNLYNEYYYKRHDKYWYDEAMKKLPMLTQSTHMLVCAEDLGMVPSCVPDLMSELRILSLEIQSMPKAYGVEFGDLSKNPYLSVSTISTHDMSTLREWWEEDHERSQRYFNQSLQIDGIAPKVLPGWLCEKIVNRHLYSPSMLCLLSLQDWLSIDEGVRNPDSKGERINIPSNPRHYWRWRMHLNISALRNNKELNTHIREMIEHSGRI